MSKKITNIAIVLKPSYFDDLPNIITNLIRWLNRRNKKIFLLQKEYDRLKNDISEKTLSHVNFVEPSVLFHKPDLLLSLIHI